METVIATREITTDMKKKLKDIQMAISWRDFANTYFQRSSSWFYHKMDGIDGNGGVGGFTPEEAEAVAARIGDFPGVRLRGVMGMATFTDDHEEVRREFRRLKALSERLASIPDCDQVSMGMSEDWRIAVEEGTTLVRIGTFIFGKRY